MWNTFLDQLWNLLVEKCCLPFLSGVWQSWGINMVMDQGWAEVQTWGILTPFLWIDSKYVEVHCDTSDTNLSTTWVRWSCYFYQNWVLCHPDTMKQQFSSRSNCVTFTNICLLYVLYISWILCFVIEHLSQSMCFKLRRILQTASLFL